MPHVTYSIYIFENCIVKEKRKIVNSVLEKNSEFSQAILCHFGTTLSLKKIKYGVSYQLSFWFRINFFL